MKGSGLLYVILVIQHLQQDGIKTLTEMVHEGKRIGPFDASRVKSLSFIITFDFLISESLLKKIVPIFSINRDKLKI